MERHGRITVIAIAVAAALAAGAAAAASPPATEPPAATLAEPEGEAVDPVRTLVPRIAAIPAVLGDDARPAAIDQALNDGSTVVAVEDRPGTLCAVVPVAAPLIADGHWERNGEPLGSTGERRRDPPGYGDCLPNDDGDPFADGVYQYVAIGATGARSAAATIVVGAPAVDVWLLNTGDQPVCMVHLSPTRADYFEAFGVDPPLQPGEAMSARVADVDQDARVFGCPPDDVLGSMRISPTPQTYVELFDETAPADTDPTPTTGTPTTTGTATTTA